MTRKALATCLATLATVWALGGLAKPPDDRPGLGPRPLPSGPRPSASMLARPRGSVDVAEAFRRGMARQAALKARQAELDSTRNARRAERIARFRAHYPPELLTDPRVRSELRNHARRMAYLHRAELVATTEFEDPKRAQVLGRVKSLLEREQARHEKRMARLRAAPSPGASNSGARPRPPAPKGGAP